MRSSSDCCHCESLSFIIIRIVEIVLTFPKINDFDFFVCHEEKVGRFHISVTYSFALQERTCGNQATVHWNKLSLGPKHVCFLPLSVKHFKVSILVHQLSDYANFKSAISSLSKKVSIVLYYIGMVLHFSQLLGLLFELIEFIKTFSLDFFESIELSSGEMHSLINFSVLLSRAKYLKFLEIWFPEHQLFLLSYNWFSNFSSYHIT